MEVLKSDCHSYQLLKGLQGLQQDNLLCDLTLVAENKRVNVHRVVMAASSDYFRALLTLDMREKGQEEIQLKGVPARGLQAVVHFAYTGELNCSIDDISDLLVAASHLQLTEAINLCSNFLVQLTSRSNCVDMYNLADQFNLPTLQARALSLVLTHFQDIAQCDQDLSKLNEAFLAKLLSDDSLKVTSELHVFEILLKWVEFDHDTRVPILSRLMCHVRLPLIKAQDLVDVVMTSPLLKADPACVDLLLEANTYHMLPQKQPLFQNRRTQVRAEVPSIIMLDNDDEGPKVYDIGNSMWGSLRYCQLETFHAQLCVLNNYMYVCDGVELFNSASNPVSGKSFRYDPRFDSWTEIAPMKDARYHFTLVADGLSIFAIGGFCSGSYKNITEQYLVGEDTWVYRAPIEMKVSAAASTVLDGKVYVSGGQTERGVSRCVWCYDIALDKWTAKSSMLHQRMEHAMCSHKNKLYVIGGYSKNIIKAYDIDTVDCYDVGTDQWSSILDNSMKISSIYSCMIGSKVYMVGGFSYDDNKKRNDVLCYDVECNEWKVIAKLHNSAMCVPCCVLFLPRNILRNITV